jgi:hypothetical protein
MPKNSGPSLDIHRYRNMYTEVDEENKKYSTVKLGTENV